MKKLALLLSMTIFISAKGQRDQQTSLEGNKETIAILSMDSRGLNIENVPMGNLVRLEIEKTQQYEVMDKYDVAFEMKEAGIDAANCFGKNQLVEAGQILKVDKMLTGSVDKFGDKIIYTLRLIDVEGDRIEKATVIEFVHQPEDIQTMTTLIVNDLLDIENDETTYEMLVSFQRPITNNRTSLSLDGPRFGALIASGRMAQRLTDERENGGLGLGLPVASMFGYQWETQYVSAGDFSALFEFIPSVNAIESSVSFSMTILHGIRYQGIEFGFGPAFRLSRIGEGYYNDAGDWVFLGEGIEVPENAKVVSAFDTRAPVGLHTGLVVAAGYTFTSGYLNFPVNVYWSPSPQLDSSTWGIILGFNIAKNPVRQIPN